MLPENVYKTAGLMRGIEAAAKQIAEIEDYPLDRLVLQRVHGRSIEVKPASEQTNYTIKQLLIMELRAKMDADQKRVDELLKPAPAGTHPYYQ